MGKAPLSIRTRLFELHCLQSLQLATLQALLVNASSKAEADDIRREIKDARECLFRTELRL